MKILYLSDFNCPYSYIGLNRMKNVCNELNLNVEWELKSFELDFDKARTAVFARNYIELKGRIGKIRVYAPAEDFDFVRGYIMSHLTGDCEIRYVS